MALTALLTLDDIGLVRFIPTSSPGRVLIGQPVSDTIDVGAALRSGKEVAVNVFTGTSVLSPGQKTGQLDHVERLLSPLAAYEVGAIRCIGLNVSDCDGIMECHIMGYTALTNCLNCSIDSMQQRLAWLFQLFQPSSCKSESTLQWNCVRSGTTGQKSEWR